MVDHKKDKRWQRPLAFELGMKEDEGIFEGPHNRSHELIGPILLLSCPVLVLIWMHLSFPPVIGKGLFSVGGKKSTRGCLEDHLLGRLCLLGLWWKKKKQHKGRRVYLVLSVRSHHPPYWKDLAAETIVNSLHHVIGWEALHDQCCDLACFLLCIQNRTAAYGMVPPTLSMCLSISPSQLTQSTNSHMGKCPESCLLDDSRSCRVDNQY